MQAILDSRPQRFGVIVPEMVTPADSGAEIQPAFIPPAVNVMMWLVVAEGQYCPLTRPVIELVMAVTFVLVWVELASLKFMADDHWIFETSLRRNTLVAEKQSRVES